MRDIPPRIYETFPQPNYVNPETRGDALLITNILFQALAFTFIGLRFWSRMSLERPGLGADDLFIVLALIAATGFSAVILIGTEGYGWNRHVWDIEYSKLPGGLKLAYIARMLFTIAATFVRASVLSYYDRIISKGAPRWFKIAVVLIQVINLLVGVFATMINLLRCDPVSANWTFPPHPTFDTYCHIPDGLTAFIFGCIYTILDLIVTTLPIPLVWRLGMPVSRRIGLVAVLACGYVATAAAAARTGFIYHGLMHSYDESWASYPLVLVSTIELDLAMACACAPAIRQKVPLVFQQHCRRVVEIAQHVSVILPPRVVHVLDALVTPKEVSGDDNIKLNDLSDDDYYCESAPESPVKAKHTHNVTVEEA